MSTTTAKLFGDAKRPSAVRVGVAAIGLAGIGWGAYLLISRWQLNQPLQVAKWAIGCDIVVDGVLLPLIGLVGWVLTAVVPPRARGFIQAALIVMGLVTLIALPLIYRRGKSAPGQALLLQNFGVNLAILLGVIAGAVVVAYLARVMRDQRASAAKVRPAQDQVSSTE